MSADSFGARSTLEVGARELEIFRIDALSERFDVTRLPFSLKILLENLLRNEGKGDVTAADVEALAGWDATAEPSIEIAFSPARVRLIDFDSALIACSWPMTRRCSSSSMRSSRAMSSSVRSVTGMPVMSASTSPMR